MPALLGKPLVALLLVLIASAAPAQGSIPSATTIRLERSLPVEGNPKRMRLYFSVLGADGKPIAGLKASDFTVRVDNTETTIVDLRPGLAGGRRFGMAMVLDKRPVAPALREKANALSRLIAGLLDSNDGEPIQAFTVDGDGAKTLGRSLKGQEFGIASLIGLQSGASTKESDLLGAVQTAINQGVSVPDDPDNSVYKQARTAVFAIAVSKGYSNLTESTLQANAKQVGVPIFVADFDGHDPNLKDLVSETGGAYQTLSASTSEADLGKLAVAWVKSAREATDDQYSIGIESPRAIGSLYSLEIAYVQGGARVAEVKYANYSPAMVILPLAAIGIAVFAMVVMALSWRRVMSRIGDDRFDHRSGQIAGGANPTKPISPLDKVNDKIDGVTARMIRRTGAGASLSKATSDSKPKSGDDWAWSDTGERNGPSPAPGTPDGKDWKWTASKGKSDFEEKAAPKNPTDDRWDWTADRKASKEPPAAPMPQPVVEGAVRADGPLTLAVQSGGLAGKLFPLAGKMVMGREKAEILVDDENASRRHAEISVSSDAPGNVTIVDLGSTNGTLVNGQPISAPARLLAGDRIEIGETVFVVQPTSAAPEPPESPATRQRGRSKT